MVGLLDGGEKHAKEMRQRESLHEEEWLDLLKWLDFKKEKKKKDTYMTKFDLQYTKMVAACPELHQGYVHLEMV